MNNSNQAHSDKGGEPSLVSVVTSHNPKRLTKRWALVDGEPKKEGAGKLATGKLDVRYARNTDELVNVLNTLHSNQALIHGIPQTWPARIVTSAKLKDGDKSTIARTNEHFSWHLGAGWMLIDYDPFPGETPLQKEELENRLTAVWPELKNAPMVWGVSSSSSIWRSDTDDQVSGVCGQRLYVQVADAPDIPRAGQVLVQRLWLAGEGRFIVSNSGSLLKRTLIDDSVWQPCRLDFAAAPECEPPLECRRPPWTVSNSFMTPVDTEAYLPDLTPKEQRELADIEVAARNDESLRSSQIEKRKTWINARLGAFTGKPENAESHERAIRAAVDKQVLMPEFELIHSSGTKISVELLLSDVDKWHGECFYDPLEPEYSNHDNRIAWANLRTGTCPYIMSHAHGGTRFKLVSQSQALVLSQGELPAVIGEVLARMQADAQIFERSGQLVRVVDRELIPVEAAWLQTYIETAFYVQSYDGRAQKHVRKDCPERLAIRVLAARGNWNLPKLTGLTSFPCVRADGSVHATPGYDAETGLLFINDLESTQPVIALDDVQLKAAMARIWQPFSLFPFVDALSRGVFLSALLTTVCRPALPTSPAFLIRAHTPGTGKTLLSECLMLLVGGKISVLPIPEGNSEEIEKRLFASLVAGHAGLILDNLTGFIDDAAISAYLTNAEPSGRILGKSKMLSAANRALWVFNGNNVTAGGDTFRRILPTTLDANTESPESRKFDFNPKQVIANRLSDYRADLINVLYTFSQTRPAKKAAGSFASFEAWEQLVRQCVCWLIDKSVLPIPIADPIRVMELSKDEDPARRLHAQILQAWHKVYGETVVRVREIVLLVNTGFQTDAEHMALIELLNELKPPKGQFQGKAFSGWLRRHKGVVSNGYRVDVGDPNASEPGWRVTQSSKSPEHAAISFI